MGILVYKFAESTLYAQFLHHNYAKQKMLHFMEPFLWSQFCRN